ncbi:MAG: DUF2244 domain-containing protein [Paracoccaceae bacterium]
MPFEWDDNTNGAPVQAGAFCFAAGSDPAVRVTLWPHRSLPRRGFVAFIGITFAMLMIPLFSLLGTVALWGLLPFLLGALGLMWYFLERSYTDGTLTEVLSLWSDRIELVRTNPRGPEQDWHANPHWVRLALRPEGGPVESYLTLKGNGREVELGAFLSPEERVDLHDMLGRALARV